MSPMKFDNRILPETAYQFNVTAINPPFIITPTFATVKYSSEFNEVALESSVKENLILDNT